MKKIGILYICTGPYVVFWNAFYESFEQHFLPETEKHYFVFTDAKELYAANHNERIHLIMVEQEPWPLPTLLKYHIFLKQEKQLLKMDYLYQSNANIICEKTVTEEMFLPQEKDRPLFFTIHPGYQNEKPYRLPYERRKISKAYVPYNAGKQYVYGAMNGGTATAYLEMIKQVEKQIEEDLKKGIIAKWHDESHINHYAAGHHNYKILSPAYCYPVGMDVPYEPLIRGVSKKAQFDVDALKGEQGLERKKLRIVLGKWKRRLCIRERAAWLRDSIMRKKISS